MRTCLTALFPQSVKIRTTRRCAPRGGSAASALGAAPNVVGGAIPPLKHQRPTAISDHMGRTSWQIWVVCAGVEHGCGVSVSSPLLLLEVVSYPMSSEGEMCSLGLGVSGYVVRRYDRDVADFADDRVRVEIHPLSPTRLRCATLLTRITVSLC